MAGGGKKLIPILIVCGLAVAATAVSAKEYNLPFDVEARRDQFGESIARVSCRSVPRPVVDLTGRESKVDGKVKTIVYRFQRRLNDISDDFVRSRPANDSLARCAQDWLSAWASAGAMLGKANDEGAFLRKWGLAPAAMSYAKIKNARFLDPRKVKTIENWLTRWAGVVRDDYSTNLESSSRSNHHLYWAAWGVLSAAVVVGDEELFDWGIDRARFALSQIRADGLLPWAMEKKGKALLYHIKAVAPLVLSAEVAGANGIDLYSEQSGALRKLVKAVLAGIGGPKAFHGLAPQVGVSPPDAEDMAWLTVYAARFPNDVPVRWLHAFRKSESRSLGGDMKLLFAAGKADLVLK